MPTRGVPLVSASWWRARRDAPSAPGGAARPGDDARARAAAIDGRQLTGAASADVWTTALSTTGEDPRARPLSVIRIALEVPALSGDERAEELARLQAISTVAWREILRPADTLAQLGPSEFGVLLPRCEAPAAEAIACRLEQAVPEAARSRSAVATSSGNESAQSVAQRAGRALRVTAEQRDPISSPVRLAAVRAVGLPTDGRDAELDGLAAGAACLTGAPAVVITLVDDRRQHFVGAAGLEAFDPSADGLPVDQTLCRHAITTGRPVLVSDTARHGVAGAAGAERRLGIEACASLPVEGAGGQPIGTVCALRRERHEWTDDDVAVLRQTALRVAEHFARRAAHGASTPPESLTV